MDAVIEAEATEDTGDFDEPQAGEVASADVDTIDEGEDEVAEAVEEAIDAADTESLEEGLSGTAEADIAAEEAADEAEESQTDADDRPEADDGAIGPQVVRAPSQRRGAAGRPPFARSATPRGGAPARPSSGT